MLGLLNEGLLPRLITAYEIGSVWRNVILLAGVLLIIGISYLLGSVNGAILLSRRRYGSDIREEEDVSADTYGMFVIHGTGAAALTALIDAGKTLLAMLITGLLFGFGYTGPAISAGQYCALSGLFVILGHASPIFFGNKGGKGTLPLFVIMAVLSPIAAGITLLLSLVVAFLSRYLALGAVTGAILYPILMQGLFAIFFGGKPMPGFTALGLILIAIITVFLFRENLKRISERAEPKIGSGRKGGRDDG